MRQKREHNECSNTCALPYSYWTVEIVLIHQNLCLYFFSLGVYHPQATSSARAIRILNLMYNITSKRKTGQVWSGYDYLQLIGENKMGVHQFFLPLLYDWSEEMCHPFNQSDASWSRVFSCMLIFCMIDDKYTFPMVLKRRICTTINSFSSR